MRQVITIDGPSGVGKGSTALALAKKLGWSLLDSGSIYRTFGLYAQREGALNFSAESLASMVENFPIRFDGQSVYLQDEDVSDIIRNEEVAAIASKIANLLPVRQALLQYQRIFGGKKNLVADGRDMGTVVFPQAILKIFLIASVEERASRRIKQMEEMRQLFDKKAIVGAIRSRDEQDMSRSNSPLTPAQDAVNICNDDMSLDDVVLTILKHAEKLGITCPK